MSEVEIMEKVLAVVRESAPIAGQAVFSKLSGIDQFRLRNAILELACQHKIKIRSDRRIEIEQESTLLSD